MTRITNFRRLTLLPIIALLLNGCSTGGYWTEGENPYKVRTSILQNDKTVVPITRDNRFGKYKLTPPFVFRVRTNFAPNAIQICVSLQGDIRDQIEPGMSLSDVPCFLPGTGMAVPDGDPRTLPLVIADGDGHNYYTDDRRIDGKGYSDIYVARVEEQYGRTVSTGTIYAVIYVDENRNGKVDATEYEVLELMLEP